MYIKDEVKKNDIPGITATVNGACIWWFQKKCLLMGGRNDIFDKRGYKFTKENFYGGENE